MTIRSGKKQDTFVCVRLDYIKTVSWDISRWFIFSPFFFFKYVIIMRLRFNICASPSNSGMAHAAAHCTVYALSIIPRAYKSGIQAFSLTCEQTVDQKQLPSVKITPANLRKFLEFSYLWHLKITHDSGTFNGVAYKDEKFETEKGEVLSARLELNELLNKFSSA